jgi:hypothetical protein
MGGPPAALGASAPVVEVVEAFTYKLSPFRSSLLVPCLFFLFALFGSSCFFSLRSFRFASILVLYSARSALFFPTSSRVAFIFFSALSRRFFALHCFILPCLFSLWLCFSLLPVYFCFALLCFALFLAVSPRSVSFCFRPFLVALSLCFSLLGFVLFCLASSLSGRLFHFALFYFCFALPCSSLFRFIVSFSQFFVLSFS